MRYVQLVALPSLLASIFLTGVPKTPVRGDEALGPPLQFNRDIRPILSENCFACHGFDEKSRQADLRLDRADSALANQEGMPAITPGSLEKSSVWNRITSTDEASRMPPSSSHQSLTEAEIDQLGRWIVEGATYEDHWAFIPPITSSLPGSLPHLHPIDAFINDRLEREKMVANPAAGRASLLRRIHLDLTGLPPSLEQWNDFMSDKSADPIPPLVDRLLKSPHYAERMAMIWLDAARYADTNGFSIDGGRHMWLWRDWVIQAYNDNMPYDQFLIQQIAGDLLPNRTDSHLIATGFQRNNMVTHEGGTIPEENLTNYNADRVKTLGEAIMGMTMGCAQCHDHKFDPLTQRDYFQLFAYFNTLDDKGLDGNSGINPGPYISAKTVLKTDEIDDLKRAIEDLDRKLASPDDAILSRWMEQQRRQLAGRGQQFQQHAVKVLKVSTPNRGAGFDVVGESGIRIRNAGGLAAFDVLASLPNLDQPITALRVTMLPQADFPGGGWGASPTKAKSKPVKRPAADSAASALESDRPPETTEKGTFRLTALSITLDTVPSDQVNLHRLESVARVTANSWDERFPPAQCLDLRNETGWSPDLTSEGPVHLTATLESPASSDRSPYMTVQLNFGAGGDLIPGQIEISVITGQDDDTDLPQPIIELLGHVETHLTEQQRDTLWRYCSAHSSELQAERVDLENLRERLDSLTMPFSTMVMNVSEKPRQTFVLNRGDYSQPMEPVEPGLPAAIPPSLTEIPKDRLGLAQWLVHPQNPLTARVAVNRLWQLFFGVGLVATPTDFGSQGEWPSHPELMDWLAVQLMEHNWDTQHIIRLIVTSQAYQRASHATPEQLAADPQNRLLARGPRFRLSAESVRDLGLSVSGLLVDRIGGPSVNPYMPVDLWREVSHYGSTPATAQAYVQDHGEKLYRRSMYTYWKRTAPPPNMMAFDAPNREVCTIARASTTTPLQALVTLNDVQFVECARAFAQRIMQHADSNLDRIRFAYRTCLSRDPQAMELDIVEATLQAELERYAANPQAASDCLNVGESLRDQRLNAVEHAAWTQVASLILNLSEAITRN